MGLNNKEQKNRNAIITDTVEYKSCFSLILHHYKQNKKLFEGKGYSLIEIFSLKSMVTFWINHFGKKILLFFTAEFSHFLSQIF